MKTMHDFILTALKENYIKESNPHLASRVVFMFALRTVYGITLTLRSRSVYSKTTICNVLIYRKKITRNIVCDMYIHNHKHALVFCDCLVVFKCSIPTNISRFIKPKTSKYARAKRDENYAFLT